MDNPGSIHQAGHDQLVRDAHKRYLAKYRLDPAYAPPLVLLNLNAGGSAPFSLVDVPLRVGEPAAEDA